MRGDKMAKSRNKPTPRFPNLEKLHKRHNGLTEAVCTCYAEAARVCLSRHHEPPTKVAVKNGTLQGVRSLYWRPPGDRESQAWANRDDATRDGAYSMSIAAVEVECGFLAVARAETRTGADYYVAKRRTADLENAYRLEVSGTEAGDESVVKARLKQKVEQAKAGESDRPAIACVVGFREKIVAIAEV